MLVQVSAPHFVAGLIMENDTVTEAVPILRWAIGKSEAGCDHLDVTATTEAELTAFIKDSEAKFWKVWIRDNTGGKSALLFRPQGAKAP